MANITNIGPRKNPIRTIFAPYFNARYQNYQNIVSNADFYSDMPGTWVAYQNAYVRQWDEWSRGFVLSLHRKDFFAVGMGKTVIDILTKECVKGGYRFDGKNEKSKNAVTEWAKNTHFDDVIQKGFCQANRLGNAILRLNVVSGAGDVYSTSHPVDRTYFNVNRRGKIVRARFVDMLDCGTVEDTQYYTLEDRVLYQGTPYYRVKVYKYDGTATYTKWSHCNDDDLIKKLHPFIKMRFYDLYGNITPGVWYKLPFKSLGCYNWQNSVTNVAVSAMEGFSDSSLHTALDVLYSIDYNWSMGQLDQYFGRTRVMVPKAMIKQTQRVIHQGADIGEALMQLNEAPLDDDVYNEIPGSGDSLTDKPQQPVFIQPDLRGEARKYIRDSDLELLASKVGLSSSTLANHLNYNKSKTATEVDTEKDTTDITVEAKRNLCNRAVDAMLKDLCEFYGWEGDVDITWNLSGKGNKEDIITEFRNGLMPLDECIKRLHPELTNAEVDKWVKKLQEAKQAQAPGTDWNSIFGLGDEH